MHDPDILLQKVGTTPAAAGGHLQGVSSVRKGERVKRDISH